MHSTSNKQNIIIVSSLHSSVSLKLAITELKRTYNEGNYSIHSPHEKGMTVESVPCF